MSFRRAAFTSLIGLLSALAAPQAAFAAAELPGASMGWAWALPFAALLGVLAFIPSVKSEDVPREEVLRWAD